MGEPGDTRTLTYQDLYSEVCRFANGLLSLGVEKGDRVAIYMGMVPELPIAMLACARLGLVHSVVFGGFSSDALSSRILDADARVVITQDGAWRAGNVVQLKANADVALASTPNVGHVVVLKRTDHGVDMTDGRDIWWHDLVEGQSDVCEPVVLNAEDPLYILYTSGTTGRPKGIVHTQGGYLTGIVTTHHYVFDLEPDTDVYWCTADIGWVTGHTYVVYGPLSNRTTSVMYEGVPNFPDLDRLVADHRGLRGHHLLHRPDGDPNFHEMGRRARGQARHELAPPDRDGWRADQPRGMDLVPADHWWRPVSCGRHVVADRDRGGHDQPTARCGGHQARIGHHPLPRHLRRRRRRQRRVGPTRRWGILVITKPWPAMARTIYGDDQRYADTYWSRFPGLYFPGDGAKRDDDGYFWLLGRVDDIMLVSGHNISTTEVESALVSHVSVAEAAVVGRRDEITGQAIAAFVTLRSGVEGNEELLQELRDHVASTLGPIAKPKSIVFTDDLPKTRSGKIMRRLLQDISEQRQLGDVTTLANEAVVHEIAEKSAETTED